MEVNSSFLKACRREPVERLPVWFMRQAGRYMKEYRELRARYDILTLCKTPELAAQITLQPVDALGVDAAILFSDLLLPIEAMGAKIHFAKGEGPVIEVPVLDQRGVDNLNIADPEETLAFVLEAAVLVKERLKGKLPLISFVGAPFTLASYLIEGGHSANFLKTKKFMYQKPEAWGALMEKLTATSLAFGVAQVASGADVIQVFDSWLGALSAEDYRQFVLPYSRTLISGLGDSRAPVIHFGTGTSGLLELMKQAGGDVIGVDWRVTIEEARNRLGEDVAIQGNLDPCALLGPRGFIQDRVDEILAQAGHRPGFIFNLGHGILPETPVENVKFLVDLVHEFTPAKILR